MRILSYDVETSNQKDIGSICAVGWVLLDDSRILEQGYATINPCCPFSESNTAVHGIVADDVKDAPTFAQYWESKLGPLMTKSLVIAHSADFDMSATEQALYKAGIPDPGIDYIDTLSLIRQFVETDSYKLSALAERIGYVYTAHHAGEDAMALVHVLEQIRCAVGLEDIPALLIRGNNGIKNTLTNTYHPKTIKNLDYAARSHCRDGVEQVDDCLCGLRFCLTGDIPGYERPEIERMILAHGGKPTSGVSGKTNYLVVGVYPDYGPDYVSGKQKKAFELISQGVNIKIISPEDLLRMIKKE